MIIFYKLTKRKKEEEETTTVMKMMAFIFSFYYYIIFFFIPPHTLLWYSKGIYLCIKCNIIRYITAHGFTYRSHIFTHTVNIQYFLTWTFWQFNFFFIFSKRNQERFIRDFNIIYMYIISRTKATITTTTKIKHTIRICVHYTHTHTK
jgi:hypothetical protein